MHKEAKNFFTALIVVILTLSFVGCSPPDQEPGSAGGDQESSQESKAFQDLEFPLPETEEEKAYLGLTGEGNFKISQIKTSVLLIEVFSNLCPHCHSEAPQVNKLYEAIEASPDLKGKIKLIGIGAANDDEANKKFKKMHDVQFPIFPDQDFSTTMDILKISTTPTFIGVSISPEGVHHSFYFESGPFGEVPQFLAQVLKLSGLEKEG
jgi:thiol-disulfide isomerase/thioredoxin